MSNIDLKRRTKIVATIGPATQSEEIITNLIKAGVTTFRLNFSHGDHKDHAERIKTIREVSKKLDIDIGILQDLQGPKIRLGRFKDGPVKVKKGDKFTGVGIMKMNEGLDTGDLLLEEKIKIENNDNLNTLSEKLSILSAKLFLIATSLIEENINKNTNPQLTKQNTLGREITYARMIEKSDFKVDWGNEAIKISQKIKALHPRANTTFRGKNLKILKIKVLSIDVIKNEKYLFMSNNSRTGIILAVIENEGIIISTKTDPIILLEAKLEGKNISSKKKLIQQLKPSVGEYLSD